MLGHPLAARNFRLARQLNVLDYRPHDLLMLISIDSLQSRNSEYCVISQFIGHAFLVSYTLLKN